MSTTPDVTATIRHTVDNWIAATREGANALATASTQQKNQALSELACLLREHSSRIILANQKDMAASKEHLSEAMLDRLMLDKKRIEGIANAVEEIIALPDPVGAMTASTLRPNGLRVAQMSIPLGIVLMIFESRPNVAIDAGALCLKSGNAALLRGGKESINTVRLFADLFRQALRTTGLPEGAITIIDQTDHAVVSELLGRSGEIDLVIPRGGERLIRAVTEQSKIPVIQHFKGICHTYIHTSANVDDALRIAINGKTHRPGVCNATETILIDHQSDAIVPLLDQLHQAAVEIRGCPKSCEVANYVLAATAEDWDTEHSAMVVNFKIVAGLSEALQHIQEHGSNHTEAIVASDWQTCQTFQRAVQSSTVVINASTRFADGGELGLGAEIGISTSKLHAYGPMGLRELTTKKFVVQGTGQIRS